MHIKLPFVDWHGVKSLPKIIKARTFPNNEPIGISVDVTKKCNLRCMFGDIPCYFFDKENDWSKQPELSPKEMISEVEKITKKYNIVLATWIGGDPLFLPERRKIVEEGIKLIPYNNVVTNGITRLPDWAGRNVVFSVSVDGTREYHDAIRGLGNYEKTKINVTKNRPYGVKVNLACTLGKTNTNCVEDLVEEWQGTGVNGIIFWFHTPQKSHSDWLGWDARDRTIDKLLKVQEKFPDFVYPSMETLELMKSDKSKYVTDNCNLPIGVYSMDPQGRRKEQCVLGKEADCDRCGCLIPFQAETGRHPSGTFFSRTKAQIRDLMGMYSPYFKENPVVGFKQ